MKIRRKQERRVPNLLLVFYFTLLVVFLSYFFTSYMAYKRLSEEHRTLEKAIEEKKKEIQEKEREVEKLQRLIKAIEQEELLKKSSLEATEVTQEASE